MARPPRPYRTAPQRPRTSHAQPRHSHRPQTHSSAYVVLALLLLLVGTSGYVYARVFGAVEKISSAEEVRVVPTPQSSAPTPALLQQPFTVLIVGVDVREDAAAEGVRSDTLIVARVDPNEGWASMLSIPRDTLVDIPSDLCPTQKINAAYACGYANPTLYDQVSDPHDSGVALAADTVEDYLGITIDYTMQVDFNGFQRLVDALGGITVDVPRAILDPEYPTENDGFMRLYYPAGLQRMNGEQALRYARTRHIDNDFGRAQRQQQVIQAGLNELQRQNVLEQIETAPKLLDALSESIRTTLPLDNVATLRGLAQFAQTLNSDRIKRLVLQPETNPDGSSTLIGDYSNLEWDPAYVQRMVRDWQTAPGATVEADQPDAVVQVQNGTDRRDLGAQVTTALNERGFRMADAADALDADVPSTVILDYTGDHTIARQLADELGVDAASIRTGPDEPAPPDVDIVVRLGDDYEPPFGTNEAARN